jgi:hypothetical protein
MESLERPLLHMKLDCLYVEAKRRGRGPRKYEELAKECG